MVFKQTSSWITSRNVSKLNIAQVQTYKLLLSSVLIILDNSSDMISSSDLFLLKVADWQNTTILLKENSSGTYVNRKIREAEGFSDLLQCVLPTNFPEGV